MADDTALKERLHNATHAPDRAPGVAPIVRRARTLRSRKVAAAVTVTCLLAVARRDPDASAASSRPGHHSRGWDPCVRLRDLRQRPTGLERAHLRGPWVRRRRTVCLDRRSTAGRPSVVRLERGTPRWPRGGRGRGHRSVPLSGIPRRRFHRGLRGGRLVPAERRVHPRQLPRVPDQRWLPATDHDRRTFLPRVGDAALPRCRPPLRNSNGSERSSIRCVSPRRPTNRMRPRSLFGSTGHPVPRGPRLTLPGGRHGHPRRRSPPTI